jgi:hypothetical protein
MRELRPYTDPQSRLVRTHETGEIAKIESVDVLTSYEQCQGNNTFIPVDIAGLANHMSLLASVLDWQDEQKRGRPRDAQMPGVRVRIGFLEAQPPRSESWSLMERVLRWNEFGVRSDYFSGLRNIQIPPELKGIRAELGGANDYRTGGQDLPTSRARGSGARQKPGAVSPVTGVKGALKGTLAPQLRSPRLLAKAEW